MVGGTTHPKISNVCAVSESESESGALQVTMDSPRLSYRARDDATPEGELNALAAMYMFCLDCHSKKGAPHDLTNKATAEHTGKRTTERTEQEKT